ncbi:MAG: divalent metal cation transporter, partial [Gammaproteobacteria bacterium]|nr:divalent metal cation transporter [Gammaproteobacteria bacterium]
EAHYSKAHINKQFIKNIRADNFIGMLFSEIATWSIIVVAATVLHTHGVTDIKTAADAAKALEPLVQNFPHAGFIAKIIFAIGILGLGFLSVPILAGSAAYAFTTAFNLPNGLNLKFKKAKSFYGIIIFSMLIGMIMNFIGINPIKALVYSAIVNGIVAVPLILIIFMIAKDKKIMRNYRSGILSNTFVFLTFMSMLVTVIAMFFTLFK